MDSKSNNSDGTPKQVLIAEDEPVVGVLLQRLLKLWGYRTLFASNGKEAVEVARHCEGQIDLLLSDVTMPGMTGPELAEKLTQQRPSLKVILISGFSHVHVVLHRSWKIIQKPFLPETIKKAIDNIL